MCSNEQRLAQSRSAPEPQAPACAMLKSARPLHKMPLSAVNPLGNVVNHDFLSYLKRKDYTRVSRAAASDEKGRRVHSEKRSGLPWNINLQNHRIVLVGEDL